MFHHKKEYQLYYNYFLEASDKSAENADFQIVGVPMDSTLTYKPGTRFAPDEIRTASWSIESYSPCLKKDLADLNYRDMGNIELPFTDTAGSLNAIHSLATDLGDIPTVYMGGEHLVTLPLFAQYKKRYDDICLIHLDAHADLRYSYMGDIYSHATVMYHCLELIDPANFFQFGIRSMTRDEALLMEKHQTRHAFDNKDYEEVAKIIGDRPVYLSIDLDVFDPSQCPGTGTPEAGGIHYCDFMGLLNGLKGLNLVAFDVVELSPPYDPSKISAALAAKVIRETVLNFWG